MKQWQCGMCGAWVDAGWTHHAHVGQEESPDLETLIMRRRIEEAGGAIASIAGTAEVTKYQRTFKEPTREAP